MRDLSEPSEFSHNVVITLVNSPADFWCRLQDNVYDFYQDNLQESYKENKQQLTVFKEGKQ